ncbi:OX-2 membrane glycoprotein [Eublepharis macularius]|uniref:OX-2 membrane glycoprotein n=1 Tax=Eublepharis macularius TaxID=481883 RepID=A0AA97KUH0_EUBMA|nr:OX-2 membrane glycoprotein [Eublepharis macularius]
MFTPLFICGIWTVVTGASQVIHKTVQTAIAGENVTLYCQLAEGYDVVQVTWQKDHGKDKTNIATYSTTHGSKVLGKYQNHVHISQSGLSISTITFHAVTLKDEGCYNCIFNTFPLGSMPGRTCLKVYALVEPKLDVEHVNSPDGTGNEMLKISCSATGKPAPVITWKVPEHIRIKPVQFVIYHPNQTVTVVSNFTYMSSKDIRENSINCVILHPSLNTTHELTLPENGVEQAKRKVPRIPLIVSFCILVVMFILGLLTFSIYNCRSKKQDLLRMVKKGLCSMWTFQGLTMAIISIIHCRVQGAIMTEDKEVELGGNVTLRCILIESLEILQVSWRKQINESSINIAALSNNNTNVYIAEEYKSRLTFTHLALNDTAITIWNVSNSDRSCYECIFIIFPSGPISKKSCIHIYDFHAFLHHHITDGLLNATCTATGFPSPTITWHGPAGEKNEWKDKKNEWKVENPNGTVSIISNILINTLSNYGQELICKVTYGGQEMVYQVPGTEKGHWNTVPVLLTILALIFVVLIIAVVCWKQHRKKHSGF